MPASLTGREPMIYLTLLVFIFFLLAAFVVHFGWRFYERSDKKSNAVVAAYVSLLITTIILFSTTYHVFLSTYLNMVDGKGM
jgi:hypothetical protein